MSPTSSSAPDTSHQPTCTYLGAPSTAGSPSLAVPNPSGSDGALVAHVLTCPALPCPGRSPARLTNPIPVRPARRDDQKSLVEKRLCPARRAGGGVTGTPAGGRAWGDRHTALGAFLSHQPCLELPHIKGQGQGGMSPGERGNPEAKRPRGYPRGERGSGPAASRVRSAVRTRRVGPGTAEGDQHRGQRPPPPPPWPAPPPPPRPLPRPPLSLWPPLPLPWHHRHHGHQYKLPPP